ncbi:hypothetical protein ACTFTM_05575 [Micromonospora sp. RB23]
MRARRVIAAASVAALGVLSLAACQRSAPDVAVYVGDRTYSLERVEGIYDEVSATYGDADQVPDPTGARPPRVTRQDVVNLLVGLELGKRVAKAKNIQVADEVSPQQVEQSLGVPATTEYTKLWGEWVDLLQAFNQQLPPAEVSDESVMAVYHALVPTGEIPGGLPVTEVRQRFGDGAFVGSATALSVALEDEAGRADVSINPRYREVGVPSLVSTGQKVIFYALPYINEEGPVTDISTPDASPSSPNPDAEGTAS